MFNVDSTTWPTWRKRSVLEQLDKLRAEKLLAEGDLSGYKPSEIRKLGLLAWEDEQRAGEFASRIQFHRLDTASN